MTTQTLMTRTKADTSFDVAIEAQDLVKTYPDPKGGTVNAVNGVSLQVYRGEIFGFLGPNGAGKTTTLEIIEGLRAPTSGQSSVLGLDSQRDQVRVKELIGVQLQTGTYFNFLTLEEILDLFGSFYPKQLEAAELLDRVGLADRRKALVKHLSGGQARRFSTVAALVNDPEVVFLDEPTTGLDPQARQSVWELIRSINQDEGKTVILTSHYMEEAETLSDRVAIIDRGEIQAFDTPPALIGRIAAAHRIRFTTPYPVAEQELHALPGVSEVTAKLNGLPSYELRAAPDTVAALIGWSQRQKVELNDLQVAPATLEDVFLTLTGRKLRD